MIDLKTFLAGAAASNTVWWSLAEVVVGLAVALCAHYGVLDPQWSGYGWTLVSAGLLVGGGRMVQGGSQPFGINDSTGGTKADNRQTRKGS
jgi:hypothetical protein